MKPCGDESQRDAQDERTDHAAGTRDERVANGSLIDPRRDDLHVMDERGRARHIVDEARTENRREGPDQQHQQNCPGGDQHDGPDVEPEATDHARCPVCDEIAITVEQHDLGQRDTDLHRLALHGDEIGTRVGNLRDDFTGGRRQHVMRLAAKERHLADLRAQSQRLHPPQARS